jgi:hypothetical protein
MNAKRPDKSDATSPEESSSDKAARELFESVVASDPRLAGHRSQMPDSNRGQSKANDPAQVFRKLLHK